MTERVSEDVQQHKQRRRISPSTVVSLLAGMLVIVIVILSFLLWQQNRDSGSNDASKTKQRIIKEVAARFEVPTDEQPQVALVQDVSKLSDEPFYKNAQNGDYVILYQKAQVILLYRQGQHKFINIAPVSSGKSASQK